MDRILAASQLGIKKDRAEILCKHNFSPVFFYSLLRTCSLKYSLSSQVRTLVSLSSPCLIYNLHCSIQKNIPECIDKIEKNENIE